MMSRVSSRQRLVSWDRFDATERVLVLDDASSLSSSEGEQEESVSGDYFETCLLTTLSCEDIITTEQQQAVPLKRKRSTQHKQEFVTEHSSLTTVSSQSSFLTARTSCEPSRHVIPLEDTAHESPLPLSLLQLCNDAQIHIYAFLDVDSIRQTMQVNHAVRKLLLSDASETLWKDFVGRQWQFLDAAKAAFQDFCGFKAAVSADNTTTSTTDSPSLLNYQLLLALASKTCSSRVNESLFVPCRWSRSLQRYAAITSPTTRRTVTNQAHRSLTEQDAVVLLRTVETKGESAVQFTGKVGQGDRCIRADQPLARPVLQQNQRQRSTHCAYNQDQDSDSDASSKSSRRQSLLHHFRRRRTKTKSAVPNFSKTSIWRPFVAPFCSSNNRNVKRMNLTPRLVSYFEVSILEAPEDELARSWRGLPAPAASSECVAVGLAAHEFSIHTRMPGWDPYSFGYHGDDGGIFHSSGSMLKNFGATYGVGDTVGCGIDYVNQCIFYTLNGQFLGAAFTDLSMDVLKKDWFPVVGLDSNCLVQCNFGCDKPFLYDLNGMIAQHKDIVTKRIGSNA
jgi:hypothetical protein